MHRRHFLYHSAATATGLAAMLLPRARAGAIDAIIRPAGHKFKLSLAAYSYREFLSGDDPELTLVDFIDACAAMKLDGTELTSYYFPKSLTEGYLRQLKWEAFRRGLDISGTAVGNDFCHAPGKVRDEQISHVKQWVQYADQMGAPVIRIFSGAVKDGQSEAQAHRLCVSAIEECCEHAGTFGIFLALENHGGLTSDAEGVLRLVRDVQSPWFGVNVDTGNFHSRDVYGDIAQIAPYALNVQVKVSIRPEGQQRQRSDFRRLAAILRDAGYRGYIVLEYEDDEDPRQACPRHVAELQEAFLSS
jgi:sugar phosphate isomerase/epimerase